MVNYANYSLKNYVYTLLSWIQNFLCVSNSYISLQWFTRNAAVFWKHRSQKVWPLDKEAQYVWKSEMLAFTWRSHILFFFRKTNEASISSRFLFSKATAGGGGGNHVPKCCRLCAEIKKKRNSCNYLVISINGAELYCMTRIIIFAVSKNMVFVSFNMRSTYRNSPCIP